MNKYVWPTDKARAWCLSQSEPHFKKDSRGSHSKHLLFEFYQKTHKPIGPIALLWHCFDAGLTLKNFD